MFHRVCSCRWQWARLLFTLSYIVSLLSTILLSILPTSGDGDYRSHETYNAPAQSPTNNKKNTNTCDGYDGVLHIEQADPNAASGTMFFVYMVNYILFAEQHNLMPWAHFNNFTWPVYDKDVHGAGKNRSFRMRNGSFVTDKAAKGCHYAKGTQGYYPSGVEHVRSIETTFSVQGNGVWDSYFEPLSAFRPDDSPSCRSKPLVRMPPHLVYPGIHKCAAWAVRAWPYRGVPLELVPPNSHATMQEWFGEMRERAHSIVHKYINLLPWVHELVDKANPVASLDDPPCLAMHIRLTDKKGGRQKLPLSAFREYATSFVNAGGQVIYLATDTNTILDRMKDTWPKSVWSKIRMQSGTFRSADAMPVFKLVSAHRANTEALVDIYAMSRCGLLVHGLSAMTEAAIYLNLNLHNRSVNLDDEAHMSLEQWKNVVRDMLSGSKTKFH